jgi:hypothetical protein
VNLEIRIEASKRKMTMPNIPEKVWLQWYGDSSDEGELCPNYEAVTWAEDKIFNRDIRFVRADVAEAEKKSAVAREREACAQIAQRIADEHLKLMDSTTWYRKDYHDGASDAGEQIADEISRRK